MLTRLLASALILSLASCTSAYVPLAHEPDLPPFPTAADTDSNSLVYQGAEAEKATETAKSRTSLLLLLGGRSFEHNKWTPVEDQFTIGVEWTWLPAESILGLEVGTAGSFSEEDLTVSSTLFTFQGSTLEVYIGPRLETAIGKSPIRIYGGLGPSLIYASYSGEALGIKLDDSDASFGLYAHAGALVELGSFNIGLDLRALVGTDISLFNIGMDADYTQIALVMGFRF